MADTINPLLADKKAQQTEATKAREGSHHFFRTDLRNTLLAAVGILAFIVFGYMLFGNTDGVERKLSLPAWLFIGALMILASMFLPKITGHDWIRGALRALGILTILIALAFSGFGAWTSRAITGIENCAATGDCSPRLEDLPVYSDGARVVINHGRPYRFYSDGGTVHIELNYAGYCLNIAPEGEFRIETRSGNRLISITPYSGQKTLAIVKMLPASQC